MNGLLLQFTSDNNCTCCYKKQENDKEFFNLLRYLKCEMYNPQYTARFAVIMEAYLKACGKSMLVGYYSLRVVCPLTRQ